MRDIRFLLNPHYANSRAIIIGIDKYTYASPLSYAVSDASEVRDIFVKELGFPVENVQYLADSAATKSAIMGAYLGLARPHIDIDDRILVFYAGHGHTKSGIRGEIGYLVPVDGDPSNISTLIRWDELTRNADLIRAKHVLFIMDACYGGLALTRNLQPGSTRFLKDMLLRYSRQVLTAGKADEVVADAGGPLPNHSVFTGHLIEGLRGRAATNDGVITANGLMAYVYGKVANDKNSNQTPHYGYFDGDGDFIINVPNLKDMEGTESKDLDRLIEVPYPDEVAQPETINTKINRIKSLLSTDSASIELHDFLVHEVRRVLAATAEDGFRLDSQFSREELLSRLAHYEDVSSDIAVLLACLAYWARPIHKPTLQKVLSRSADRLEKQGGLTIWLALRWYPLILELYCAGIAAVYGKRFDSLAAIFYAPVPAKDYYSKARMYVDSAAGGWADIHRLDIPKQIPGNEQYHTPLSEHFFKIVQPKLDDTLFLGMSYDHAFDAFEIFFSLAATDIDLRNNRSGNGPIGRFGWKHTSLDNGPLIRVVEEGRAQQRDWEPLQAGLFGGSYERFERAAGVLIERVNKLRWF